MGSANPNRHQGPGDHHDYHDAGHVHDLQSLSTRLRDAFNVFPPKIDGDHGCEYRGSKIHWKSEAPVHGLEQIIQESRQILTRGHAADWTGQDIVEHQGGDGELCQCAAHGFLDHAVNAAAHKHAAALDVHGSNGVGKEHDGQDE